MIYNIIYTIFAVVLSQLRTRHDANEQSSNATLMRKDISIESKHIETEDNPPSCDAITSPFSPNDIRLSTPPMNMGDIIDMIQYHYIDFDLSLIHISEPTRPY